ncbi:cytidine deaminase [Clostridium botulinum]|nr:cytidine deaminase [Clostridium botulinum]NFI19203.1 cytidine deaminase [Clostridium botulinum]NFI52851.1 cytidine deaminase [Clostridium botulinum]NFL93128.1 cytidine deaminase [Clostridium botulinum]NFN50553.1 cytidine deaminase [Clostridium botulinum]
MERIIKENYYLDIAETVLERGTCLRRNYGSIIVKNDEIISTGYTGAPRGRNNCIDINSCIREKLQVPRGTHYELCRSVHSEANAIISASRRDMIGATLYLVGRDAKTREYVENANSCSMCKRLIINAGISYVVIRKDKENYLKIDVEEWIQNDDSLNIDENFGY